MDRRTGNVFLLALVLVVGLAGGAVYLLGARGAGPSAAPEMPSMTGVVVGVDSAGLDKVRGFTLRTADGTTTDFTLGGLTNGVTFAPGHLVEHQATAQPVTVWYRIDGATHVAVRIEDAP